MADSEKKTTGEKIRDLFNAAIEDPRKPEIQLNILSAYFQKLSEALPRIVEGIYKEAADAESLPPEARNMQVIANLTLMNPKTGEAKFPVLKRVPMAIVTDFAEFFIEDIKELPGYIALHVAARKEDVALNLRGLTAEEAKGGSGPHLIIDATKSYEDGSMFYAAVYPTELPPLEAAAPSSPPPAPSGFDRHKPRSYNL